MEADEIYAKFEQLQNSPGVYKVKNVPGVYFATKNLNPGETVYDERLFQTKFGELREFSHKRSKLASSLMVGFQADFLSPDTQILYLGASFGTTVSHLSDALTGKGLIFAVEFAPRPTRDLLNLAERRPNIIPILGDARHPEEYNDIVHQVDFVFCDVSQPNQSELFMKNIQHYLKPGGKAFIAIKSKSISQIKKPYQIFAQEREYLEQRGLRIDKKLNISKFHRDHEVFYGTWQVYS